MLTLLLCCALALAGAPELRDAVGADEALAPPAAFPVDEADPTGSLLAWAASLERVEHPEPAYGYLADHMALIAQVVAATPERITPVFLGRTVQARPIWGFRVRSYARPVERRVLVFAALHPQEWISTEVAVAFLLDQARHPIEGVEVIVVPVVNVDRRLSLEASLLEGEDRYFRTNAAGVDLNRDFAHNRESEAIWRHLLPDRYTVSPGPLSQPETQALDRLAAAEDFDVVVSLHAFGGFFYHPWAGRWARIPREDRQEHVRMGNVMAKAQGAHAYKVRQLARWGFFFRGLGMEVDHFYAEHGAQSWLIELTRSGLNPMKPDSLRSPFRLFNPEEPARHVDKGVSALRALVGTMGWELRHPPALLAPAL